MARPDCPKCGGTGWKILEGDREISPAAVPGPELAAAVRRAASAGAGVISLESRTRAAVSQPRVAVPCDCVQAERAARGIGRAHIPARYEHCDFENFETDVYEGSAEAAAFNRNLTQAKVLAEGFARDYPMTLDAGLLFVGPCGVGKTHLAVAVAKQLIARGHEALFYDYRELLKEIQGSYNALSQASELSVLEPVLTAEVLLLDDLGAGKPSAWVLETIGHILTKRYNEKRVTLLTTNYLDSTGAPDQAGSQEPAADPRDTFAARRAPTRDDSLTDRIGARIRSRLYEMCRTVEMHAPDFRKEVRKADRLRP
jgi:DNA replication protein DnaC